MNCPHCGVEIHPAALMGAMKKTMTEAAIEQRKKAGRASAEKRKAKKAESVPK